MKTVTEVKTVKEVKIVREEKTVKNVKIIIKKSENGLKSDLKR